MGDHHSNPVARANAVPQRNVPLIDIGEGYALLGIGLRPMIQQDEEGNAFLVIMVTGAGGKPSTLVPMEPVEFGLGEVGRLPLANVREQIDSRLSARRREGAQ